MAAKLTKRTFISSYWNYFLELEEQLISTKRYVDFDIANNKTFSIEYLKLLQATCSEIDVVAKTMAEYFNSSFKSVNDKNIQKWGFEIQNKIPDIGKITVHFNNDYDLTPWANWKYETYQDKNNRTRYRLANGCRTPTWWNAYNKVKHERTSHCKEGTNYMRANLENLVFAMAALYILESLFLNHIDAGNVAATCEKSKLFSIC